MTWQADLALFLNLPLHWHDFMFLPLCCCCFFSAENLSTLESICPGTCFPEISLTSVLDYVGVSMVLSKSS